MEATLKVEGPDLTCSPGLGICLEFCLVVLAAISLPELKNEKMIFLWFVILSNVVKEVQIAVL